MKLNEIKEKIAELRNSVDDTANECWKLWTEHKDTHTENVANYLYYELTCIKAKLSDLEETEDTETDTDDEEETILDWWTDLDLRDKCELANIPYPTCDYGRGDDYIEAEERANTWWNSRTYEQKKEIYEENLAWWDKE